MRATLAGLSRTLEGDYLVTLQTKDKDAVMALQEMRDRPLRVEAKEWKDRRSRDANAYFHVLVNAIARVTGQSDTECKRRLVIEYGALERDGDGKIVGAKLPAHVNIADYFPYARQYSVEWVNGREWINYLFYKHTHTLDTKEMSKLIDGTIDEAKALGIETLPPHEIAAMEAAWSTKAG